MTLPTFLEIRRFHVFFELVMGSVSYGLNFLVIYLAVYKSNKALEEYRVIIILGACIDLIFTTGNVVTMQLVDLTAGKLIFANGGLLAHLPQPYALVACVFWMFGLFMTVINVALTFFFRYNVLCCRKREYLPEFARIYGVCVILIASLVMLVFVCFETNESDPKYTVELKANGLFAEETPPFSVSDATKLKGIIHMILCDSMVSGSYGVVFWTGIRIHRMLNASREHMSSGTLAVQRQLTIILIFQAVGPFFMLGVPIVLAAGLPLLGVNARGLGLVLCSMVTFLPLMNPIAIILVVPSFRRTVLMRPAGGSTVDTSVRTPVTGRSQQPVSTSLRLPPLES